MELPPVLNVVIGMRAEASLIERIRALAPDRLNVVYAQEDFRDELARDWPERRQDPAQPPPEPSREFAALLYDAHVLLLGYPAPKTTPARAPNLIWVHFTWAGVSNLQPTQFWRVSQPLISTSRGYNNVLPIAESMMAAVFMFARRLDVAVQQSLARDYRGRGYQNMQVVSGKTLGIVGLGGIGSALAQMARGCGMRVVATRRSAEKRRTDVEGVDVLYPTREQNQMLADCDFVAVCAMWTPETERMLDAAAFAALKPGAYLMNTARGEIIDEAAMAAALQSGHLAGAYLDVWDDDLLGVPPCEALQAAPNVIFTPHNSGRAEVSQAFGQELFLRNLERLLKGAPMENVIDWQRGY